MTAHDPSISRTRDLVLRYGWNSTSFQIVNPGISRWFSGETEAVVGFVTASGVRVVVGAPVCDVSRVRQITREFESSDKFLGKRVCYFGAETRLESALAKSTRHTKFLLGAQPVWRPTEWARTASQQRSLRSQLNRARNKGVNVIEWTVAEASDNLQLKRCLKEWLDSKGLPPLHFMVESDTLSRLESRRIFVASRDEKVVGFLVLSPVATRNGWLFEQFPHAANAPNGTVELMIDVAMRTLAEEGSEYVTLGLSPLSKRAEIEPFHNPLWLRILLAWLRKHGQRFYNFDGLDAFKAKLKPERWEPVFAVSNESKVSFRTLYAIAGAFSGNAPFRMFVGGLMRAAASEIRWVKKRIGGQNGR